MKPLLLVEDSPFGQDAAAHQLISVIGILASAIILYVQPDERLIKFACGIIPLALFWFVFPGHAIIYGPHLWLLVIRDLILGRRDN